MGVTNIKEASLPTPSEVRALVRAEESTLRDMRDRAFARLEMLTVRHCEVQLGAIRTVRTYSDWQEYASKKRV